MLYALAMGIDAVAALVFGYLFDRKGIPVLISSAVLSAFFAPLVFMGGFSGAVLGMALWGIGMGAQESILRAAIATLVPPERRGTAYGLFNAAYGIAWFLGSALMGYLYDTSLASLVAFSVLAQLAAIPLFVRVAALTPMTHEHRPLPAPPRVMKIANDVHVLDDDQSTADHLVDDRQHPIDFLGPVHDFDLLRQVVGKAQQVGFVDDGVLAEAHDAPRDRGTRQSHLAAFLDDRDGQIASFPGVGAADVDRHALPLAFDLHVSCALLSGNSPRVRRWAWSGIPADRSSRARTRGYSGARGPG